MSEDEEKTMEKETKGVRTKRQLYQCAMKLFRERGFDRVSVDEIVREAGMAKGTFYIYFNTKSDIILEMLRQYDTYYDQIMAGLPDDLSIDQQMEEIVKGACRFTEEVIGLDLIRVLYVKQLTEGQEHPGLLNDLSIDQQMEEIVKGACRFTEEVIGLDLIRVLYVKQLTEGQEHPGLLNEDRALFRILSELLTAGQRAGIYDPALDVPDTTRLILHGIRASFFEWCSSRGQFDLTQGCLYFLHTFCRGIYHAAK